MYIIIPVLLLLVVGVAVSYFRRDTVSVAQPAKLNPEAKIVHIGHEKVGIKGDYHYKTTVRFDDGFVFEAHDTKRKDYPLSYEIRLTPEMREEMIFRAKEAHAVVCEQNGLKRPTKPFVCGKCGNKGPYENSCPECGSSLRKYIN